MLRKIIDKWKLNRTLLASKIGISKGAFNNKLSDNDTYTFTEEEEKKVVKTLLELKKDLEKLDKK